MIDEDDTAGCGHLVSRARRDMHAVLPRDQSGRHSDVARARVREVVMYWDGTVRDKAARGGDDVDLHLRHVTLA